MSLISEGNFLENKKMQMSSTQTNHVTVIHTLGPAGTNCEKAAHFWFKSKGMHDYRVILHDTLEVAVDHIVDISHALLGCVVYPDLHRLVFSNFKKLYLSETFVMDTYEMVLATKNSGGSIESIVSHPAPVDLVSGYDCQVTYANSNASAAQMCRSGVSEACVTTGDLAERFDLNIRERFGIVPMGFTIHRPLVSPTIKGDFA